ncbi:MAG TPA: PQQ-binding-like beta-propeller repeat protein [Gemmatimonadales bacterium]|nr:PQQ-binding-like beta-propeller repeat protein [Gemmatimonadales bacterium]
MLIPRLSRIIAASVLGAAALVTGTASAQTPAEWTAYGRDASGARNSPLTQITPQNVAQLSVAWTYQTGDLKRSNDDTRFEATPLMVDGTLYLATPFGRVIALDPATGRERWTYDAMANATAGFGDPATRGVSTWLDPLAKPGAPCRRRIYLATLDARIVALDSKRGVPCRDFGHAGSISLRQGLRNKPFETAEYEVTSPPAVIRGLLVTGSAVADNNRTDAASGEVRAYDARTGALRWTWDPVPRDSTDPAWNTWRGPKAHQTGAANAWSVISADSARDLVFVPTGSASPDYYGGERLGDNRYANSIVALRASTGKVVWAFQTVHHDLWDYDNPAEPVLATIVHDGRKQEVVLAATKTGQLFVLDRDTGVPVFPVEERPVPASTVPGEQASPTQPFNTVIPPLSPQRLPLDSVFGFTQADRDACLAQIRPLRNEGSFTPPSLQGTLVMPGNVGGAHWGGVAYDTARQIAVVPVNHLVAMAQLIPLAQADRSEMRQNESRLGDQYTMMRGTPYVMRRRFLTAPSRAPCVPPPWGALVAIDLKTGAKLWDVPLGDAALLRGDTSGSHMPTGLPNLGGATVTASGLTFIGAAIDRSLRAFDTETGAELWRGQLPAGARATPMTYSIDGKQYVVICAGGGNEWGRGDYVVAFALPSSDSTAGVGFRPITIPDPVSGDTMPGYVFYPADSATGTTWLDPYRLAATADAQPSAGARPLVVISHGHGGSDLGHYDLATYLASHGFVVATLEHPGDNYHDMSGTGTSAVLVGRPIQVAATITALLHDPAWKQLIDADRIGVAGFSAGGYTGLMVVGGVPDFHRFTGYCNRYPDDQEICAPLDTLKAAGTYEAALDKRQHDLDRWGPTHDPRVKAAFLMAPWSLLFDSTGVAGVDRPVFLYYGQNDPVLVPDENVLHIAPFLKTLAGIRMIPKAGHYVFLPPCSPELAQSEPEICTDPPGVDRVQAHARINADALAFFRQTLRVKGSE